jgi:hypothetical protein
MKLLFKLRTAFLLYIASTVFVFAADSDSEYGEDDTISSDIFVTDKIGSQVHLASLIKGSRIRNKCAVYFWRRGHGLGAAGPSVVPGFL